MLRQEILQSRRDLERMEKAYKELTGEPFAAGKATRPTQPPGPGIIEALISVLEAAASPLSVAEIYEALTDRGVTTTMGTVKQVANRAARRNRILRPEPGRFTVSRQDGA